MKHVERCSCGATLELSDLSSFNAAAELASQWRADHHHSPPPDEPAENIPGDMPSAEQVRDPGSVTSTAHKTSADGRPPRFGFSPRGPRL